MDKVTVEMTETESEEISQEEIDQLKSLMEQLKAQEAQQLSMFAETISGYRKIAIDGRKDSGIEEIWDEDEDSYAGVDDANREEELNSVRDRKVTLENAFNQTDKAKGIKSTVFLNITRPYVDAVSARTGDMLLPNDDRSWAFKSTPIPEIVQNALDGDMGQQAQDLVKATKKQIDDDLKKAELQVDDWLIETDYTAHVRQVIEDCANVGTGVIKGPFPERRKTANGYELKPSSKHVKYRNLFPDPDCGEDIQNGKWIFEKDNITVKRLKELGESENYLQEEIAEVLKEGPDKRLVEDDEIQLSDSESYEIWYFHGLISKDDLEVCGCNPEEDGETFNAMATMVNDRIIHVNQSPIETDDFPYDVITLQKRKDHWTGIGISRQIRTPQRMLVAGTRNMMDNAGMSAGPQIIYRKDIIKPADGNYEIVPNKQWVAEDDVDVNSVANAFITINIPSMQRELNEIIMFALKMAEDVTGMPMLMQGSQGTAPDTVGGMQILNNNANTILRRLARNFDTKITIPHVKRYYAWLYQSTNSNSDYQIEARGSSTLVERDIQNQAILQMGQMSLNPEFGIKPDLWMQEYLKSLKFDPKRFQGEEEEPDKEKEQMAQALQGMEQELNNRTQEKQAELEYKYAELQQEREIALMNLAMDRDMKLEDLKVKLGVEQIKSQENDSKYQQDVQLKAIDGKIKIHEARTHRMREENNQNELRFKAATGKQGI